MCLILLVGLLSFGSNSVIAAQLSPDHVYCAEVIVNDQGALGGATIVNVFNQHDSFQIGSFELRKGEQEVYFGKWHEFQNMHLEWQDNHNLVINGEIYPV